MIRSFCNRASFSACAIVMLLSAAGLSPAAAAAETAAARADEPTPLKIGLLLDLSSGSAEVYRDRQRAFELAIEHVNEGGGVFGLPVTVAVADATADPEKAVAAARRLVEVEGVHAIVGPNASASALPVAERVIGPAAIPTVSFSATSPALTAVADNGFLFRAALSDVSQGPVLARLARERGFRQCRPAPCRRSLGAGPCRRLRGGLGRSRQGPSRWTAPRPSSWPRCASPRAGARRPWW